MRFCVSMCAVLLVSCADTAEQAPADRALPPDALATPAYVAEGACPFECCHYGRWRLSESAILRVGPASGADSVGYVAAHSTVPVDSGVVIVATAGLVAISAPVRTDGADQLSFGLGDTIEVLDYQGEGVSRIRWRDSVMSVSQFWDSTGSRGGRLIRAPDLAWWARVADGSRHGWMQVTAIPDSGADACE